MDRYLGGEEIAHETLTDDLEKAVARASFHPVVPVCSVTRRRVRRAARPRRRRLPVAARAPVARGVHPGRQGRPNRSAGDPRGALVAEVVKTSSDQYVGRVSLVRVFSGTLTADDARPRVRPLHVVLLRRQRPRGPRRGREDRLPVLPLRRRRTSPADRRGRRRPRARSASSAAPRPATPCPRSSEPRVLQAVVDARAAAAGRDRGEEQGRRGQAVAGAGPARRRGPEPARREQPRDPPAGAVDAWARPTPTCSSRDWRTATPSTSRPSRSWCRCARRSAGQGKGLGRHVKQSGGHGQYAVCHIEVEPLPEGGGFRVRRQGRRRRGAAAVHPLGREGRARPDGARASAPATRWSTCG